MINIQKVTKRYDKTIFENLDLAISNAKITCILGASGVGKTTLLKMIAGMTSYEGKIEGAGKVAYIFQEERLIPSLTVMQNLKLICPDKDDKTIEEMLTTLKILDKKDAYPKQLSGGEAKRVSIARAFLYDGETILMDEPFSSLDFALKLDIINYFIAIWKKNPKTVLLVTHDVDEAILLGQEIYVLAAGKFDSQLKIEDELPRNIRELGKQREIILLRLTNQ